MIFQFLWTLVICYNKKKNGQFITLLINIWYYDYLYATRKREHIFDASIGDYVDSMIIA